MEEKFFGDVDRYLFHHGTHYKLYEKMGAHLRTVNGVKGVQFVVWAPNAKAICVLSDGNGWTPWADVMTKTDDCIWELFVPGMRDGVKYKYRIVRVDGSEIDKCDPYAFFSELRPANASVVADLSKYEWGDGEWLEKRAKTDPVKTPISVYEVHLGSWKKDLSKWDEDQFFSYRRLAHELCEYVLYMGYTHIELMGICEYPFDPSWGYQVTGYFAPTARYGSYEDFMYFVDYMHKNGVGVILDWVPAHFPKDDYGLSNFDGTPLYEYADPLRAEYPEWGTKAFDLGKKEVSNFLIASAFFWVEKYHVDALRVDAVAAMLYSSFGREKWRPNKDGGDWNLESFEFFRHLNSMLRERTSAYTIAEDSSILPKITAPVKEGGLGFGFKWNMGWMNDTLKYMKMDPVYRSYHHSLITHTLEYAFLERYMLVLSHDEVVYGKGSMYRKFTGSHCDKLGALKACYTMMTGHPGKKLLFMGQDFAQENEWNFRTGLDWWQCDEEGHRDVMNCCRALLHLYKEYPVLYDDENPVSFEWIESGDTSRSIFAFIRRNPWNYNDGLIFVCNFTPTNYDDYGVGVPVGGVYKRLFSTYPTLEGGNYKSEKRLCNGRDNKLTLPLRPFEGVILKIPKARKKRATVNGKSDATKKSVNDTCGTKKSTQKANKAVKK